jgi:hypothetical protein
MPGLSRLFVLVALAAVGDLAAQALPDRPFALAPEELARVDAALAPFVAMARSSYATAKQRFEDRLPRGYRLFVTTDLEDSLSRREQAFVLVDSIDGDRIGGTIASDVALVSGFAKGDGIRLDESSVKDWTIVAPDGTEEGNFVGRFVDHYRPGKLFVAVFAFRVSPQGRAENTRLALVTDESTEPLNLDLPPEFLAAAMQKIGAERWPPPVEENGTIAAENLLPLVFDPDDPDTVYGWRARR